MPKEKTVTTEEFKEKQRQKWIGYLIRLGAVFIWGMQPILVKYSPISEIDLNTRVFFIFLGGTIISAIGVLLVKYFAGKIHWNPKVPINKYFILSIITLIFLAYFVNASLNHTTGVNFILLNNFAPIFALIIAVVFWKNKISYLKSTKNMILIFIIFLLGSIGSSLLFYNDLLTSESGSLLGNAFAVAYMIMDVLFTISLIKYSVNLKSFQSYFVNFYTHAIATAVLFIPFLLLGFNNSYSLSHYIWLLGISMLLGIGILLNYEAFRRMDGFTAFLMFNISILITFVIEAFILQEIPTTWMLLFGASLIIGASIFAEKINTKCEKEQIKD